MSSLPTQIAETIQTAHINRHPSPRHDFNPPTAASSLEPVEFDDNDDDDDGGSSSYTASERSGSMDRRRSALDDDLASDVVPLSALRPARRRSPPLYPVPDLRFEQSYLHSIAAADTWWKVAGVTVWHQVFMPLAQGVLYNLALVGWQHWNRGAQLHGHTVGARVRRWWYGVNNWKIPDAGRVRRAM